MFTRRLACALGLVVVTAAASAQEAVRPNGPAEERSRAVLTGVVHDDVGRPLSGTTVALPALHRDLRQMVEAGRFREDLWYRLSVFPIEIPPFRERPEDIPALASHFAARAGHRIGGAALHLSAADVELLVAYGWPGNVREVASVIERAVILGDGKRLHIGAALGSSAPQVASRGTPDAGDDGLPVAPLHEAMAKHIERALRACRGQVEGKDGAAALLRINPHTLRSRMRKLGVDARGIRESAAPDPLAP